MTVPYSEASSGASARDEVVKILRRFGCSEIGFIDNYHEQSVVLTFVHQGRAVELRASARGWANLWLKENPWSTARRSTKDQWEQKALDQGLVAISSILRDWVKGQVTAIETGVLSFEHVMLPYMIASDGRTMIEHLLERGMLPPPASSG